MAYRIVHIAYRKNFVGLLMVVAWLVGFFGCASLKEGAKGFLGISTKELERARKDAVVKTFNDGYFNCFTKTLDSIKDIRAYVYSKDIKRHLIAIYVSEADTTPVGIFFKEIAKDKTQLEVCSPSSYAQNLIAEKLFAALEK